MSRILIIDDEESMRFVIRGILDLAGHSSFEAADGEQGIKVCCEERPNLVITDLVMPNKEGIETIKELRNSGGKAKIIAISGGDRSGSKMYLRMAEKLGADGILAKPIRRQELLAKIEEVAARYGDGRIERVDGISVSFADWHFNVRASNTEPLLRLNLEALTQQRMEQQRDEVLAVIQAP